VAVTHADSYQLQFIMIEKVFLAKMYKCASFKLFCPMGLYHPLDGDTNLKYKLLGFLTPNKKIKENGTSF
jgi:hypothetical protein